MIKRIEHVIEADLCVGCGACVANGEGVMRLNEAGFLRPVFHAALDAGQSTPMLERCPGVQLHLVADEGTKVDTHWGPIRSLSTGAATDAEVRFKGSSGGAISALLIHLLDTRSVDFVCQIAVDDESPLLNRRVISRTRADVLRAAGSRYAPAAPLEHLAELFSGGETFAFVGKPCDVAAMRAYLQQHPERRPQVPYLLSFMCAGVPSQRATDDVLAQMGTKAEHVVRFQYRGDGWPGYARAVTREGTVHQMDYASSWGGVLGRQLQLRCKLCPDGTGEFADVVCADAWHSADGYPDFEEKDGRSLVVARTRTGEGLIERAKAAGALATEQASISDLPSMQPYQLTRKQVVLGRWLAIRARLGVSPTFKGLRTARAALHGGLLPVLRNAVGTYRRLRRGEA